MATHYMVFQFTHSLDELPLRKSLFHLMYSEDQLKKKLAKKILKKIPIKSKKMDILGIEGRKIYLPTTEEFFRDKDETYKRALITGCLNKILSEESPLLVVPQVLEPYMIALDMPISKGIYLSFSLLKQVMIRCINETKKSSKDIHYVIIDGEDSLSTYCIDLFYEEMNYLTVITKRKDYFEQLAEKVFKETGLVMAIIEAPLHTEIEGDIVINCNRDKDKSFFFFKKNTVLIDFLSSKEAIRNILIKRKDLKVIDRISIQVEDEVYDSSLLEAVLFGAHRALRSFMIYGYKHGQMERVHRILNQYPLKVQHFYQYGRKI